jgi:hypothetical protein
VLLAIVMLCRSNDDKQQLGCCSLFGCHIGISDMAPGLSVVMAVEGSNTSHSSTDSGRNPGIPPELTGFRPESYPPTLQEYIITNKKCITLGISNYKHKRTTI